MSNTNNSSLTPSSLPSFTYSNFFYNKPKQQLTFFAKIFNAKNNNTSPASDNNYYDTIVYFYLSKFHLLCDYEKDLWDFCVFKSIYDNVCACTQNKPSYQRLFHDLFMISCVEFHPKFWIFFFFSKNTYYFEFFIFFFI